MNKRIRIISFILAFVVTAVAFSTGATAKSPKESFEQLEAADEYTLCLDKDGIELSVNTKNGSLTVYDKSSNLKFYSNPQDVDTNPDLKGAVRTLAQSQLALTFFDVQGNSITVNSAVESVNKGGLRVYKNENCVKCLYNFPDYKIEIPIIYSVNNGRFEASIPCNNIKSEDDEIYLSQIELLPYFGASNIADKGMFIVPDGSGSIINFGSCKTPTYEQELYGIDRGKSLEQLNPLIKSALLPMIATSYINYCGGPAGLVAYVEEGQSLAIAYADATAIDKCYNSSHFGFIYRSSDLVTFMDQTSQANNVVMGEKSHVTDCDFTVSYTILPPEKSSITDLAHVVRERVFKGKIPEKLSYSQLPVYIQAYMSVQKTKYFLGIPYKGNLKLTDIEDCSDMLESFGDTPVIFSIRGLEKDGAVGGAIDSSFNIKRSITNYNEFNLFTKDVEKKGGKVYPYAEFTEFTSGNKRNRVLSVANLLIERPYFNYGSKEIKKEYKPFYILKNSNILENVTSWIKSAHKRKISNCAPFTLSNSPYRSGGGNGEDRYSTQRIFSSALDKFQENNIELLLEEAAAYAIPYAENLKSLPITSSGLAGCDTDIPFLQIVLHGIKSYSMPSMNFSGNDNYMFLKAIETGSSLDYTFVGSGYSKLKETPLDSLNGSDYSLWREIAPKQVKELSVIMKDTVNSYISDYRIITNDVRAVSYENGSCFIINYGNSDYNYKGIKIEAMNYKSVDREVLQ